MKAENEYKKAIEIFDNLQKDYKMLKREKVINHAKYIALIRKAAYKGNPDAQYELGLNYEDQNYFIPNPMYNLKKRFYWYSKAAEMNHPEACNNLASLYEKGEGVKKNMKKALFFYKKAYQLGCSYAKNNYKLLLCQLSNKI
jgi:uncharacterized protein